MSAPEVPGEVVEAARVIGEHGYARTSAGHECPCGHVYCEQPPGAYMEPDLDWLGQAVATHRATEVAAWVRRLQAEAWDEGHDSATGAEAEDVWFMAWTATPNPYLET